MNDTGSTADARKAANPHYVSTAPFDPYSVEALTPEQERYYLASQWKLMWWKLTRHKVALVAGAFLLLQYMVVLIAELLAPYNMAERHTDFIYAPPQAVHLFHQGKFVGPFVYGLKYRLNPETLRREYTVDTSKIHRIRFFCRGDALQVLGRDPDALPPGLPGARTAPSSCSAPTGWGATCSRASPWARASR